MKRSKKAGRSIAGASPPKAGIIFQGNPTPVSSPIKATCCCCPSVNVPGEGLIDEPSVSVAGFASPLGDKVREGLEPSIGKVVSEEGELADGLLRSVFGSLAGSGNKPKAPLVEVNRNVSAAAAAGPSELLASDDNNGGPVPSLPPRPGLTST